MKKKRKSIIDKNTTIVGYRVICKNAHIINHQEQQK